MHVKKLKLYTIFFIFLLIYHPLIAQDNEESGYQAVQGLETWHHDIDISDYPAGTYNIIIKGSDKAGNEYFEGPYNIFVDPESDKPIVNISNPEPLMSVNGNINIIGTCVDDDSVERVEIMINDGIFREASGKDFWSYYLDTANLEDGEYQITAKGIDINGVEGDLHSVKFILDRNTPRNEIISYPNGALVNGKIVIEGITTDRNGIDKLEISTDGGETFRTVSIKSKKNEPSALFKIRVDTRDLEDGPHIYWFRSTDKIGSIGISSYLFFVDNKPPGLEILYPTENNQVNGKFTVTGLVSDEVGVDKLIYIMGGGEAVEIPLSVGDPYWSQQFDLLNKSKTDIKFSLTDKTGNTTSLRMRYDLDVEGDKPVLQLSTRESGQSYKKTSISGFIQDDDAVKEIIYSVDGGTSVNIPAKYSFNTTLEETTTGLHKLEIYAVDINGVKSNSQELVFNTVLDPPKINFTSVIPVESDEVLEAVQALEMTIGEFKSLSGTIEFQNKAAAATMMIDKKEELNISLKNTGTPGEKSFSIMFKDIEPGYHSFTVKAVDSEGLTAESIFHIILRGIDEQIKEKKLLFTDERFTDVGKLKPEVLRMHKNEEIIFYVDGGMVKTAELSGANNFLKIDHQGPYAVLTATSAGWTEKLELTIETTSGKSYLIGPFPAAVDDTAPVIQMKSKLTDILVNNEIELSGKIHDDLEIKRFEYSINGSAFTEIPVENDLFAQMIDLSSYDDGGITLLLRAEDRIGNQIDEKFLFTKDTGQPELKQIAPLTQLKANGIITFSGRADDVNGIRSIEFSEDGENFKLLDDLDYPVNKIKLNNFNQDLSINSYRITDAAGNINTFGPEISMDIEGDIPTVRIQIPEEGILIQDDFTISGMAFDDDQVKSILYRMDDGEFIQIGTGHNFEVPVSIKEITDNAHSIEIKAVDLNGVESAVSILNINVSKSEPISTLITPDIENTVNGIVKLKGTSSDPNGIKAVLFSYDNGNTFNRTDLIPVEETESGKISQEMEWSYSLDTELLNDGSHSLMIKAADQYDVVSIYTTLINIDNTPPVLTITQPIDGSKISGLMELKAMVADNIEIGDVYLEMKHLAKQEKILSLDLSTDTVLQQKLDFSDFDAGWINMQITATDKTGNITTVSRNVEKIEDISDDKIIFISPSKGGQLTGDVLVQGRIENMGLLNRGALRMDEQTVSELELSEFGFFHTIIEQASMTEGVHNISLEIVPEDGKPTITDPVTIYYKQLGPWIKIDNFNAGDFATNRPWLSGTAGYNYIIPQLSEKDLKEFHKEREIAGVEISLDNGKTFETASGTTEWKYRLQTQELANGELWLLARVRFNDGASAVTKTMLVIDETPPDVELVSPNEGMRFNDSLKLVGSADDEYGIDGIFVDLREGSKTQYQVPSFIQGLYIDAHFFGSSYAELGLGLTFFDDNVKLQMQGGISPPGRFSGAVIGLKLLANIAVLPWDYFFGYDFNAFSSSFAVGTTFNYFSMPDDEGNLFSEDGLVLGALIGQLEIIKFDRPDSNSFSSFSLYAESQLWFISSDVSAGVEPRLAFGLRTNVF